MKLLIIVALCGLLASCPFVYAGPLDETRYCGPPERLADGSIKRRADVIRAFRRLYPCPSTGLIDGPCPMWSINHDRPLACGGCDSVANLSWMRNDIKKIHDSYERKIYGGFIESQSCKPVPIGGIQ